jgi:hypothetical protein
MLGPILSVVNYGIIAVGYTRGPRNSSVTMNYLYSACRLLLAGFLLVQLFALEDVGSTFDQNVTERIPNYTVLHPRRWCLSLIECYY